MPKKIPSQAEMKAAIEAFKKQFTGGFYHGSPSNKIKAFDPSKGDRSYPTEGVTFVTRDSDFADSFLGMNRKGEYEKGSTVYPVSVNMGKHFVPGSPEGKTAIGEFVKSLPNDLDAAMSAEKRARLLESGAWDVMEDPRFLDYLKNTNHDSFTVMEGGIPNVGIFDPKNIRGKFAKFNPEDAESTDFMKAEGGPVHMADGKSVMSDIYKNIVPAQMRTFGETLMGDRSPITEKNFTADELDKIRAAVIQSRERQDSRPIYHYVNNKLTPIPTDYDPTVGYRDYNLEGGTDSRNDFSVGHDAAIRNTLGKFSYKKSPEGNLIAKDSYDFKDDLVKQEGVRRSAEYEGMSPLQKISTLISDTMDPRGSINTLPSRVGSAFIGAKGRPVEINLGKAPFNEGGPVGYAPGGKVGAIEALAKKLLPLAEREANKAKFLENSAVKDRLYHGTTDDISAFDPSTATKKTGNVTSHFGTFLSDDPAEASRYAELWGTKGGNVMPVHAQLQNPYMMPYKEMDKYAMGAWNRRMAEPGYDPKSVVKVGDMDAQRKAAEAYEKHTQAAIQDVLNRKQELIGLGHDGIIANIGGKREIIPFDSKKIKSAIGNTGTYNPLDPDITKKEGGPVGYAPGGLIKGALSLFKGKADDVTSKYHPQVQKALAEGRIDPADAQWMSDYAHTPGNSQVETGTGAWKDQSERMQNFANRIKSGEVKTPPGWEK